MTIFTRLVAIALIAVTCLGLPRPVISASRYGCPARTLIKPCTCTDKNKGLDISCEGESMFCKRNCIRVGGRPNHTNQMRGRDEQIPFNGCERKYVPLECTEKGKCSARLSPNRPAYLPLASVHLCIMVSSVCKTGMMVPRRTFERCVSRPDTSAATLRSSICICISSSSSSCLCIRCHC